MAPLPAPSTSTSQQHTAQQPLPLRRATYVHVSDLISAYNIDHGQLDKEIARVNAKSSQVRTSTSTTTTTSSSSDAVATAKYGGKDRVGIGIGIGTGTPEELLSTSDRRGSNSEDSSTGGVSAPEEDTDLESTLGPVVPQKRLQPPRGGFNLCVLVGEINLVVDKRRVDQSRVRLAEVEIGDETGTVSLRARDEQIDLLERVRSKGKPGAVVLRNCTLELYQGKHIRLAVTKWGKLTEYPDHVSSTPPPPSTMHHYRNFSLIDLSVVASEIAEKTQLGSSTMPYASASSTTGAGAATSSSRQTKKSEAETTTKTSGSSSSASPKASPRSMSTSGKQGKFSPKHMQQHQQQTSRRNAASRSSVGEQRRQARNPKYGGIQMDTGNQPPPRSDQMMYRGMQQQQQGYHVYGEQSTGMRMRQQYHPPHSAPYTHHSRTHSQSQRHQDAASAQFALHQQYEMQQRQLHQLYSSEQNRHVGQVQAQHQQSPAHQQTPSPMMVGMESSFDTSEVSNSPILVPPPEQQHYSQLPNIESHSRIQQDAPHGAATYPALGAMSGYRIGRMNPEARTFAPTTYLSAAQGSSSQQHMAYHPQHFSPYNMSQQQPFLGGSIYSLPQSGLHPSMLMPSRVGAAPGHHHTMSQAPTDFDATSEQQHEGETGETSTAAAATAAATTSHSQYHRYHQYPPATPSTKESKSSRGKENVTSKPRS